MKNNFISKRFFSAVLMLFFTAFSAIGCYGQSRTQKDYTLWIVTEETVSDGMNDQAQTLIQQFVRTYPEVSIQLDILPTEESERITYLEELYALMDAGSGPDIFILPTEDVLTLEHPQKYTYLRVTPLFPDVNIAMRDGYFMDISEWYDSDKTLGKEALNTAVMDAGIVNGSRFTLPLRYDAPILYVWDNYFEENGIDSDILNGGIDSWMEYVIHQEDPVLACGSEYISILAFSDLVDYKNSNIILSQETAGNYLRLVQQVQSVIGTEINHRTSANLAGYISELWTQFPVQINTLGNSLAYAAIAESEHQMVSMYPIRTMEGDFTVTIKYYAAIGANCKHPELAYEFIRLFLLEESQWEQNRLQPATEQYRGLIMNSWPVRTQGSVEPLWNNYKQQINKNYKGTDKTELRQKNILNVGLTDSSIPALELEIDIARFPVYLSPNMYSLTYRLNDYENGNIPTDIDITSLVNELICNLQASISK